MSRTIPTICTTEPSVTSGLETLSAVRQPPELVASLTGKGGSRSPSRIWATRILAASRSSGWIRGPKSLPIQSSLFHPVMASNPAFSETNLPSGLKVKTMS